jgi:hypothetical protein
MNPANGPLLTKIRNRSEKSWRGRLCEAGSIAILIPTPDIPALLGQTAPVAIPTATLVWLLLAAAALSVPSVTWRHFGLVTTLVHELGHAFASLATGRRVTGIHLNRNHSGATRSVGRGSLGIVVSGFFGYPAPALVAAGALWCVTHGYQSAALAVAAGVALITLLFIRNWFGALVTLATAGASAAVWWYAPATGQAYVLLVLGVALLVGSVRAFIGVVGVHTSRRQELATSDAYLLYKRTRVPSPVWLLLMAAVIGWCGYVSVSPWIAAY